MGVVSVMIFFSFLLVAGVVGLIFLVAKKRRQCPIGDAVKKMEKKET